MSYLGVVLNSVFAANALFVYGLGLCPAFKKTGRADSAYLISVAMASFISAVLLWLIKSFMLAPLGLEDFDVVIFMVFVVPATKYLARLLSDSQSALLSEVASAIEDSVLSCLVLGISLSVTMGELRFLEAVLSAIASVVGYWAATVLLDAIRKRLDLSDVPRAFRGMPSLLLSAGLIGMAFMGIDSIFIKNLVG